MRVAVVERLQQFYPIESDGFGMGYPLSIAGHLIIALLLMFGLLERIELVPVSTIPVEIVMVKPAAAARQDAPAPAATPAAPAASAASEQD
ncbi:hypothetical protein, partial [Bradyrhizobium sp.]|uniref:hypothetical protein n=1 Tax=Bradyrhizobium sp. TaxID=376 RepID=UPI003C418A13